MNEREHILILLSCVVDLGMGSEICLSAAHKGLDVTCGAFHVSSFCIVSKEGINVSLYTVKLLRINICTDT